MRSSAHLRIPAEFPSRRDSLDLEQPSFVVDACDRHRRNHLGAEHLGAHLVRLAAIAAVGQEHRELHEVAQFHVGRAQLRHDVVPRQPALRLEAVGHFAVRVFGYLAADVQPALRAAHFARRRPRAVGRADRAFAKSGFCCGAAGASAVAAIRALRRLRFMGQHPADAAARRMSVRRMSTPKTSTAAPRSCRWSTSASP